MQRFSTRTATAALAIAAALLAGGGLAAQTQPPAPAEAMCDYCGDFTDAAVASATVATAYRPGAGYAERRDLAAAAPCGAGDGPACLRPGPLGKEVAQIRLQQGVGQ